SGALLSNTTEDNHHKQSTCHIRCWRVFHRGGDVSQKEPGAPSALTADRKTTHKALTAAAIGNATEWYDFGVYSYLSVIIGLVFYPSQSTAVQLLATFTTFAGAFLFRPLGGMFFVPLGDRIGRKQVLAITMLLMAVSTFPTGNHSSPETKAILPPVELFPARMLQSCSTGGEYGGATTIIAEYPPDNPRGFLSSWF